jgi:CHAT domain-containing protein
LDPDSVLLEYCLGTRQSYGWAVSRDHVSSFALPPAGRIETVARAAYGQLQKDAAASALAELSRILLEPVRAEFGRKRIIVVPDGILQFIPFSTLTDMARPHTPLLAHHELVNLPSAASLAFLRREEQNRPGLKQLAVFADPVFDSQDSRVTVQSAQRTVDSVGPVLQLRRLPFTRLEAQSITSNVAPADRKEALDFEASRELFLSDEISRYRILHLATHAVLDTENPELSGVALSMVNKSGAPQDGFVRLVDLYHMRLGAELVVLSACETALGKDIRGEGLIGLTRGFMYAGAPRVVSSLWKVDDRATAELMRIFYDGMLGQDKLRPAAALRRAQLELSKQPRWRSPYYWGAFVLQGEWR